MIIDQQIKAFNELMSLWIVDKLHAVLPNRSYLSPFLPTDRTMLSEGSGDVFTERTLELSWLEFGPSCSNFTLYWLC